MKIQFNLLSTTHLITLEFGRRKVISDQKHIKKSSISRFPALPQISRHQLWAPWNLFTHQTKQKNQIQIHQFPMLPKSRFRLMKREEMFLKQSHTNLPGRFSIYFN